MKQLQLINLILIGIGALSAWIVTFSEGLYKITKICLATGGDCYFVIYPIAAIALTIYAYYAFKLYRSNISQNSLISKSCWFNISALLLVLIAFLVGLVLCFVVGGDACFTVAIYPFMASFISFILVITSVILFILGYRKSAVAKK